MPNITQLYVKSLGGAEPGYRWDTKLRGFAVRVLESGRASFYIKYRTANGEQRKHCIGPTTVLKADQARARAEEILAHARCGRDLVGEMRTVKMETPTIAMLAEKHMAIHQPPAITASTAYVYRSTWRTHIIPLIGAKLVAELTREDVREMQAKITGKIAARHAVAVLSKALVDCEDFTPPWRQPGSNPCFGVKKHSANKRKRILSTEELQRFMRALEHLEKEGRLRPEIGAVFRLLVTTGLRWSEWANARWEHVDLKHGMLHVPFSKTGPRDVQLSPDVVKILSGLARHNEWVIPNRYRNRRTGRIRHMWLVILERAQIKEFRVHDLRHTAATIAHVHGGANIAQVSAMLGHSNLKTTSRYVNVTEEMAKDGAQKASSAILRLAGVS